MQPRVNLGYKFIKRVDRSKIADITDARALTTEKRMRLKLNMSYGHERINREMSVYFDDIGRLCSAAYGRAHFQLVESKQRGRASR